MRRLISTDKQSLEQFTQVIIVGKKFYLWRRLEQQISLLLLHHFLSLSFSLSLSLSHTHTHTHTHTQMISHSNTNIFKYLMCLWESNHKEGWVLKNWCFQIVVLEKTFESPLDCKIKPVNPKGNQPWIFIAKIDAEALILWLPDSKKANLLEKPLMLGKIEGRRRGNRGWDI